MEKIISKIGVRDLVEFIMRKGDIDTEFMGAKRATIGTKIHSKLQRKREQEAKKKNFIYEKEISLRSEIEFNEFKFVIDGRVDGIITDEQGVCIEEIKSTYVPLEDIRLSASHRHLAQGKSYGYMYCKNYRREEIYVAVTYYNINTDETRTFKELFLFADLEKFMSEVLDKYYVFAKINHDNKILRNETIKNLNFPYDKYRKSQRELSVAVYNTVQQGKKLFVEAPTGTGKTISAIFPSLKAMAFDNIEKIFYLTAKTITRQVAEDAFVLMFKQGLQMKVITLTAKDKICFKEKSNCNPIYCEYASGHFDRVNTALADILKSEFLYTRETIEKYAKKHRVCPFEFCLDISVFCDCVIGDYNHVYDSKSQLKRFFGEGKKNNFIILNDESHNLLERSRDMYSASLNLIDFKKIKKLLKSDKTQIKFKNALEKVINKFLFMEDYYLAGEITAVFKDSEEELPFLLFNFTSECDKWLLENKANKNHEIILELYFKVLDFLRIAEYFGDEFVMYLEKQRTDLKIKLLCLDTSKILSDIYDNFKSIIFFSATLSPIEFYRNSLGGNEEDFGLILDSPFEEENMKLIIDKGINTRYKFREKSYIPIANRLFTMLNVKKGNYIVFFPSYIYLEKVLEVFNNLYPDIQTLVQDKNLNEEEREIFLKHFKENNSESMLAFCVLGGIFSEGIDLVRERLIGVCVVSVGIPMINNERDAIMNYYNEININGYDFAYKFPGVNKVLQAGGRVIRTEIDRGIVYLIDNRFGNYEYTSLYPKHWKEYNIICNDDELKKTLKNFWDC